MPAHSDLDIRMKENYEKRNRSYLTRRTPVIIRIDGRAFHTFTKGFAKPYDKLLMHTMQETMKFLCENIQGCVLGYTQSDEISLLLIDYAKLESDAWFDYQIEKVCSISASMTTLEFNRVFSFEAFDTSTLNAGDLYHRFNSKEDFYTEDYPEIWDSIEKYELVNIYLNDREAFIDIVDAHAASEAEGAMFDSRCFNIPPEEVTNYFYSRQIDATRNSIQMAAQAYFSAKELHGKNQNKMQDMLHEQKGINWNDYCTDFKRGSCCKKEQYEFENEDGSITLRSRWVIDHNIPKFSGEDREYIEKLLRFE